MTEHDLTILECLTWGITKRFHIAAYNHFFNVVTVDDLKDPRIKDLSKCFQRLQISAASQIIENLLEDER